MNKGANSRGNQQFITNMKDRFLSSLRRISKVLKKEYSLPKDKDIQKTIRALSSAERVFLWMCIALLIGGAFIALYQIDSLASVKIPREGGKVTEGVIGSPRYINPLLANSNADKEIVSLVYSGLMKYNPKKGLVPDLAKGYKVSKDGLTYTFTLKKNIYFHDGEPVTAEDVVFTIRKAKDPALNSPKRGNWDGIKVKKLGERKVRFILKTPYTPFIHNTTIGILPKHIWKNITPNQFSFSRYNIQPIGSGPYKVRDIKRTSSGLPSAYVLSSFPKYTEGEPYINKMVLKFYSGKKPLLKAYREGEVDNIHAISAKRIESVKKEDSKILHTPLPRVFGVFFNKNQAKIFANQEVREALSKAVNKKRIVREVFAGYATPINQPIPPSKLEYSTKGQFRQEQMFEKATTSQAIRLKKAKNILGSNGWSFNEDKKVWQKGSGDTKTQLSFSISTSNVKPFKETARILKKTWEKMGAKVEVKIFETSDLNQQVIRPRDYEALLFGEVIGRGLDLYPFWHSSQQSDPGLNVATYANIDVDKLLEQVREIRNPQKRLKKYKALLKKIKSDQPAVFLYAPHFTYLVDKKIKGVGIKGISKTNERFMNVSEWYIKTDRIWSFLID